MQALQRGVRRTGLLGLSLAAVIAAQGCGASKHGALGTSTGGTLLGSGGASGATAGTSGGGLTASGDAAGASSTPDASMGTSGSEEAGTGDSSAGTAGTNAGTAGTNAGTAGTSAGTAGTSAGTGGDSTTSVTTAFRISSLSLRDPHVFVNFLGCHDATDTALSGFSVNGTIQKNVQLDNNADSLLDLSYVLVFRPLDQTNGDTTNLDLDQDATCTAPLATTTCTGSKKSVTTTATTQSTGVCAAALPSTTHPYSPTVTSATGPCFSAQIGSLTISLAGIPVTLQHAVIAGTYGSAGSLMNGLISGFVSQTDADSTIIPATFPLVGGQALSALLAGGANACPTYSDKDSNDGVVGWYFYLNFTANAVQWSE